MSGNDELFKSLEMLKGSMDSFAQGMAARDAQKQINQMNSVLGNEKDRLAAANDIGQQLALRLQAAGAPADQIMATAGRLSVSAGENAQMQLAKEQQQAGFKHADESQARLFQQQKEIEQMKLDYMRQGMSAKTAKLADQYGKEFYTQNKKEFEKLDQVDNMINMLGKNPKSNVVTNLAQMEFVKAAVGRANWAEIQMGNPNQSIMKDALNKLGVTFTNEDITNKAQFFKKLGEVERSGILDKMQKGISGFSQAKAELVPGIDAQKLESSLRKQHLVKYGIGEAAAPSAPTTPPGQQAPGHLPDGFSPIK